MDVVHMHSRWHAVNALIPFALAIRTGILTEVIYLGRLADESRAAGFKYYQKILG